MKGLKLEGTNGTFLRPKNYMIHEAPMSVKKEEKAYESRKGGSEGKISEYVVGGIVIENNSLKAYSKLVKNAANRNAVLNRR